MKEEERLKKLMLPFMLLLAGVFLVSCGDDEEDVPEVVPTTSISISIIGTWYEEGSEPHNYEALVFDENQKLLCYSESEEEPGQLFKISGTYTCDEAKGLIMIKYGLENIELWTNVKILDHDRLEFDVYDEDPSMIDHFVFLRYKKDQ